MQLDIYIYVIRKCYEMLLIGGLPVAIEGN